MPNVAQKPSDLLEETAVEAWGAVVDGRGKNIVFRHKQLIRLFDCLKNNGAALLESLSDEKSSSLVTVRLANELTHALKQISILIERIPANIVKASAEYATLSDAMREGGVRRASAGTVVILGHEAHPFASWAVPLATAVSDGNCAIVSLPPSLSSLYHALRKPLSLALDQSAFHLVCLEPSVISSWLATTTVDGLAGVITLGDLPVPSATVSGTLTTPLRRNFKYNAIPTGPCAFIVDQSLLPDGQPLHPLDDGVCPVPPKIDRAARALAAAHSRNDPQAPSSKRSLGLPAFVLVHENIASLFTRALKTHMSSTSLQPHVQAIKGIENILSASSTSSGLDYLPIFAVTSMDHALDLVQDRLPESFATYVFADSRFGAYFNNNCNVRFVCVNQIPGEVLTAGPYTSADDFSNTIRRTVKFSKHPLIPHDAELVAVSLGSSPALVAERLAELKIRQVKQVPGARIDFFGGSFLLAAGTFLSILLGASGYGIYKGGKALLSR
ncbi:hypothetical protein QFC22_005182 [Naganishia vaughanmartiniae]|uniref:Uncharacterized protein n=1 Tax=Naganishia vaughanmartiniae TaxID=1424756 RepID=A0ACC2WW95_9TREE|nr:hypothetical protein QFC22_005182 [Naganishia vaughanmartiniae]